MPDENTNVENAEVVETPVEVTPEVTPETTEPTVENTTATEGEPTPPEVQDTPAVEETPAPTSTIPNEIVGGLDDELQAIAGAKPMTKETMEKYIENLKVENPEKWERRKEELERKLADLSK